MLLAFSQSNAESVTGYCRLKAEKFGQDFLELQPICVFETAEESGNWCKALIRLYVKSKDVYQDEQINANVRLYDSKSKKCARTITSHTPISLISINDTLMLATISGYIEKSCINSQSIPEKDLSNILLKGSGNAPFRIFENHLKQFDYTKIYTDSNYESWVIKEPDLQTRQEKPRILIVFYKHELISVFYTRAISIKHYDCVEYGSRYKLIYNTRFNEEARLKMLKLFRLRMERF